MLHDTTEGVKTLDTFGALDKYIDVLGIRGGDTPINAKHTRRASPNHMSLILYMSGEAGVGHVKVSENRVQHMESTTLTHV